MHGSEAHFDMDHSDTGDLVFAFCSADGVFTWSPKMGFCGFYVFRAGGMVSALQRRFVRESGDGLVIQASGRRLHRVGTISYYDGR